MKVRYLLISLPLVVSFLTAQTGYSQKKVVGYAKAIDVGKLDPILSSQRLDEWLRSGPVGLDNAIWEISDCDLKPDFSDPKYVAPLCVKVRFKRDDVAGWVIITVGTARKGVIGPPHLETVFVGSQSGVLRISKKLSDLPNLLNQVSVPRPSPGNGSDRKNETR